MVNIWCAIILAVGMFGIGNGLVRIAESLEHIRIVFPKSKFTFMVSKQKDEVTGEINTLLF